MTAWIAIYSNDIDGESVRELETEGSTKDEAIENLDRYPFDESWKHYSLVNIRPKRGGVRPGSGRPKGIKRAGTYGEGVATKPVRVPVEVADSLPEMIQNLSQLRELLNDWEQEANSSTSPRYDRARKLISEIKALGF